VRAQIAFCRMSVAAAVVLATALGAEAQATELVLVEKGVSKAPIVQPKRTNPPWP
jgi:hypothetical protein